MGRTPDVTHAYDDDWNADAQMDTETAHDFLAEAHTAERDESAQDAQDALRRAAEVPEVARVPAVIESLRPGLTLPAETSPALRRTLTEPVQQLGSALDDVLDVDAAPDRTPEEALTQVQGAINRFQVETAGWR